MKSIMQKVSWLQRGYTDNVIITKDAGKPVRLDKAFPSWYTVYHDVDQRNQAGEDLEVKSSDID